jgi:uncharacterized membrane protein
MQTSEIKRREILEKVNRVENIGFFVDSCSIILIVLIAGCAFIGYLANAIESNYLRLFVYVILMIFFSWIVISATLVFIKRKLTTIGSIYSD